MPPPIAAIVITASVLIAAGIAAYESPQVREWVDKSRRKIAVAIQNFGEELVNPSRIGGKRERNRRDTDPSMGEEKGEEAEERRRQARAEILERVRILEERRRRKKAAAADGAIGDLTKQRDSGVEMGDVDPFKDDPGNLSRSQDNAMTTAFEHPSSEGLTKRNPDSSAAGPGGIPLRDLPATEQGSRTTSNYETNLRQTFNLPLPPLVTTTSQPPSSHVTSPSLVDLTPTSSEFPDPDYSIPDSHTLSPSPFPQTQPGFYSHDYDHQQAPSQSISSSSYFSIPHREVSIPPNRHQPPQALSDSATTPFSDAHAVNDDEDDDDIPTPLLSPHLSSFSQHSENEIESDAFSEISHPHSHSSRGHAGVDIATDHDAMSQDGIYGGGQWSEVSSNVSGDQ